MDEKILVIDDNLDTARLICIMFQKLGYQTVAASDGEQGLQKVSEEPPDLILLDVMMPVMDGYEVARRLRYDPNTKRIPILMFTAKSQANDKAAGFDAGADDYLTKPTNPSELQAHVKALLSSFGKKGTEQIPPPDPHPVKAGTKQIAGQKNTDPAMA